MDTQIDITFDMYSDTPSGKDPDALSPTLRRYHKLLWSKPLPSGTLFNLSDTEPKVYLCHLSGAGEFRFSSDAITHTYHYTKSMTHILDQIPEDDLAKFYKSTSTIGAYVIFPSNRINKQNTINGARGMNARIKDRFDLTLECIRRHYVEEDSPLADVLMRYSAFFDLFKNFKGYVDFFLFHDLVSDDYSTINFYLPFDNFHRSALPLDVDEYFSYKGLVLDFVLARNQRMLAYVKDLAQ